MKFREWIMDLEEAKVKLSRGAPRDFAEGEFVSAYVEPGTNRLVFRLAYPDNYECEYDLRRPPGCGFHRTDPYW